MKDYVSRQAIIEAMMKASTPAFDKNGKPTFLVDYVKTMECLPSADVESVVHCKDCKYYKYNKYYQTYCCCRKPKKFIDDYDKRKLDDYCSRGKRRESE